MSLLRLQSVHAQIKGRFNEYGLKLKSPFLLTQFSSKDGLPQNQVISIIPRKDNSLILYTANGIVDFNGYEFKPIVTSEDYKKQFFTLLDYYAPSDLLFGLDKSNKLLLLSPNYREIKIKNEKPMSFYKVGDSLLIITENLNLYHIHLKTLAITQIGSLKELAHAKSGFFPLAFVFRNHEFYIGFSEGLYAFNTISKKITKKSSSPFYKLKFNDFNEKLFCFGENTMNVLDMKSGTLEELPVKIRNGKYLDVTFLDAENYFIGCGNQGLYFIHEDYYEQFKKEDGIFSNNIQSFYYDSLQDCLFAGTFESGLLKLNFKTNYSFSVDQGLSASSVNSIIRTEDGHVLAGQNCCYIKELKSDTATNFVATKAEFSSLSEINGLLFAGTWGSGVKIFDKRGMVDSLNSSKSLSDLNVHACFKDSKGLIWIGTSHGLSKGNSVKNVTPFLNDKIKETVICFYELKDHSICVGVAEGAYIIKDDKIIKHIGKNDGFKGKEIRSFYEDSENKLWLGSYDGGLYCYDKGKLTSINNIKGCLLDKDVFTLAKDEYGYFYITSNHGLWRVSEKALNDFYYGRTNYLIPFLYDEETGLLNNEFNGGFQNNYLKTKMNHFYFPSLEGIVVTVPDELQFRKLIPTIDRIFVNDSLISSDLNTFKRSTFSVQFDFSCANFITKNNVHFQHKLIGGKSSDWGPIQNSRSVYFKMLPPGKYTFILRALDGFNDTNPAEASFEFEIEPYFYETAWFRVAAFLVLGIILFFLIDWRTGEARQKEQQKEQYSRKVAEIELKAIQAQLNPHFIFNCLNTIKYFILEKDFDTANKSLNKFSSLIRDSLENSDKLFIEFKKEIKFLNNYIELEKLRIKEQLEYEIESDPAIDPETNVPRLLIQPYVENAIKHGISNLEHKTGQLKIKFEKIGHFLVCTIIDNGIGRTASRILSEKNQLYTSKGTQLTKEKSAFLKQYNNYNCTIETEDLYNASDSSHGTKVIITIPLYDDSSYN